MCLGVPMRVVEADEFSALCEGRGVQRRVDLLLIGPQQPGTWLLIHLDTARQVLDADEAARISDALDALDAALSGQSVDGFFADLDREPQLPAHLRPAQGDAV